MSIDKSIAIVNDKFTKAFSQNNFAYNKIASIFDLL